MSTETDSIKSNDIVVFGGNGYVGSRICEEAILQGYNVTSISRSGMKPLWISNKKDSWVNKVNWVKGDGSDTSTFINYIRNIRGVVSCIGAFHYKQSVMEYINGDININVCKESSKNGVQRFVYISADKTIEWFGKYMISGYFNGKLKTENAINEYFSDNGVALRAGAVNGTRYALNGWIPIPLYIPFVFAKLLIPVVHRDQIAKASLRFITSNNKISNNIVESNDIENFFLD